MIDAPGIESRAPDTGRRAEDAALAYLGERGLRAVERNFRCRAGEIDLIMRDGACLVFVEVRYRSSDRYGSPAESVSARKQARLLAAAQYYLQMHPGQRELAMRFDVVAVRPGSRIEWISDAFGG
jgi:putative endonuclease